MRILVLGGTNFIGRHIVRTLRGGDEVTVLNRGTHRVWGDDVRQLTADRTDPASVAAVLSGGFDAVVDVSGTEPEHIASTAPVLRQLGVSRYVFISSGSVYDSTTTRRPFREGSPTTGDPIWGAYGAAKARCERLLADCGFEELTVLRPPYVYGPGNSEPREQFLWSRLLARRPVLVPGDGSTQIQFCHVQHLADLVSAACRGSFAPGVYNVGDHEGHTFDAYLGLLARAAGSPAADLRHVTDPRIAAREYFPFRDYSLVLDTSAVAKASGLTPVPLIEGLEGTFRWFREHGFLGSADSPGSLDYPLTPREEELTDRADPGPS